MKPHSFNTPVIGSSNTDTKVPKFDNKNSFNKTSSNNLLAKFSIIEPLDKPKPSNGHQHKNSSNNLSSLISLNQSSKDSPILSTVKAVSSFNVGDFLMNSDNNNSKPLQKHSSKAFLKLIIDEENSKGGENEYKELSYFNENEKDKKVPSMKKKNSLVIRGR